MITKADRASVSGVYSAARSLKLSTLEKSMLKWITVDRRDKVLDANIENGLVAEYLRRNIMCEVCGFSSNMNDIRTARSRLQNCDIMYGGIGDIPWQEETFDTVLLKAKEENEEELSLNLKDIYRVLKKGGQLVVGVNHGSQMLNKVLSCVTDHQEDEHPQGKSGYISRVENAGFIKIFWQRTGITNGVIVAWKAKEAAIQD